MTCNNSLLKMRKYRVVDNPSEYAIGTPIAKKINRLHKRIIIS